MTRANGMRFEIDRQFLRENGRVAHDSECHILRLTESSQASGVTNAHCDATRYEHLSMMHVPFLVISVVTSTHPPLTTAKAVAQRER